MRRMLAIAVLVAGLFVGGATSAHAGGGCPGGSVFVANGGHGGGGVCEDVDTGDIVKTFRPRLKG